MFVWLSGVIGLPVDQVNFVVCQVTSLVLGGVLRIYLKPNAVNSTIRHAFGLVVGVVLGFFCFGRQAVALAGLPAICYIIMRTQDAKSMQRMVLIVALAYLSCAHIYRQIYEYGSYNLDITGPLMVITQKVTSLAYNIHDGHTRAESTDITPLQRYQAIKIMPTTLEYFSYIFHFQTLMAGPLIFYRDYIEFIHGSRFKGGKSVSGLCDDRSNGEELVTEPSPLKSVIKKLLLGLICAVIFIVFIPIYPVEAMKDIEFLENTTFFYRIWYMYISTLLNRFKYYYAWVIADAICNNSGMGFNGLDDNKNPQWNLISNVDAAGYELSTSFKGSVDVWNKGTTKWLRMIAYERSGRYKTALTFGLSALWHGFYPGYYITAVTAGLFTMAARTVRRKIRPLFLHSESWKIFYDTLTFLVTRILIGYILTSFMLLEFMPSIRAYLSVYLLPHLVSLAAIIVLPMIPQLDQSHSKSQVTSQTISDTSTKHDKTTKND